MRAIYKIFFSAALLSTTACSTLNESMQLGAGLGALSGASATYAANSSPDNAPSFDKIASGAAIGLGVGLITSYLVHNSVEADRQNYSQQPEMYFGDLPPSPFIFSNSQRKG